MIQELFGLNGKVVLITGGTHGIGMAIGKVLGQAGAKICVNDLSSDKLKECIDEYKSVGVDVYTLTFDVTNESDVDKGITQIEKEVGEVDILVNNAAILRDRTMKKMQFDEWQDVIDTNLTGVFRMCKSSHGVMNDGGRIVNMASISAVVGFFGQSNYSASKAGVIGLTKVLSKELASRQITVNAVAPGVVLTEMGQSIPDASRQQMLTQIPLGRLGTPDDIANAILFLCSPLANYITGQTLHVNGGWIG